MTATNTIATICPIACSPSCSFRCPITTRVAADLVGRVMVAVARGELDGRALLLALGWEQVAVSNTGMIHTVDYGGRPVCGLRRFRVAWVSSPPTCAKCRKMGDLS